MALATGNMFAHDKSTMYVGQQESSVKGELRPIVINGSNVAMSHGLNTSFSPGGIDLVVK